MDAVGGYLYVFNVRGNQLRIVAKIVFRVRTVYINLLERMRNMISSTEKFMEKQLKYETEEECDAAVREVERLMDKGEENLTESSTYLLISSYSTSNLI